jgi:FMN phosphatase YigB (HAD superfamily)
VAVKAVVFDVGETLVDETRHWEAVADEVGVPRLTLFCVAGAVIERGGQHWEVFDLLGVERVAGPAPEPRDVYPDVLRALSALRAAGYRLGIAGNQPDDWGERLRGAGLDVDFIGGAGAWDAEKPAPAFYERVAQSAGVLPAEIAYVGDRIDNDVQPANRAGMVSVLIRRGPWGYIHAARPEASEARLRIDSLDELPGALAGV